MPPQLTKLTKVDPERVAQIYQNSQNKLGVLGLAQQRITPLNLFDFYYDDWNNLVVKPGKELANWTTSFASSFMPGKSYTPTMPPQEAAGWRVWCEQNPALYNLLIQISPAFKAADVQARLSMEATKYPGDTIPSEKVLQEVKKQLESLPSVIESIASVPQVAGGVSSGVSTMIQDVWSVLSEILKILQEMWPAIQQMWHLMRENMKPAFDMLNQEILQPYRKIAEDGKIAFEQYRNMVEEQGRSVDAAVPPVVGPNVDEYVKLLPVLAKYFSLPVVGSIARAELQTMSMVDYQAVQQRGFATPLRVAEYAAGMVAPAGPGQALTDVVTKPPAWFLSNI